MMLFMPLFLAGCTAVAALDTEVLDNESLIFTTTKGIHPNMPEFTFHRIIGSYVDSEWPGQNPREVSIIIEDENGSIIQEITGLTQGGLENDWYQLSFADYNFDGFLDMHLVRYTHGGASHAVERYFWLWDDTLGEFVENKQLPQIIDASGLYANQETRLVEASGLVMGSTFFKYHFEYFDGEFVRVARDEYRTQGQIHPDMPLFIFRRIIGGPIDPKWPYAREVSIVIEDENDNVIQEIWGLVQENLRGILSGHQYDITLADYNFDGYLDMHLVRFTDSGVGMLVTKYFWLWDAVLGQFVENQQLTDIVSTQIVDLNHETRQIERWGRVHSRHHILHVYEYHRGEFIHILEEEHVGLAWYWEITRTDHMTGEITVELQPFDENISATNPPEEIFMMRVDVNPDMTPLIVQMDIWEVEDIIEVTHKINITIRQDDIEGTMMQQINDLEVYFPPHQPSGIPFNLHFADYNQDGYLDMALQRWSGGTIRNNPHFYWLWDVQTQQFALNDDLTDLSTIGTLSIEDDGTLRALHRLGPSHHVWWTLAYADGSFGIILTEEQEWFSDEGQKSVYLKTTIIDHIRGTETTTTKP